MSLSKLVLVLSLLVFALPSSYATASKDASSSAKSSSSSSGGGSKDGKKGKGEGKSKNKMALEGGLYTTDKVSVVKSNKGTRPQVRLVSPMQRAIQSHTYEGEDAEKYGSYTAADLNPFLRPCGGTKPGKVHFTAEMESKAFIAWKTVVPDETGNCTIKLSDGADDQDFEVLVPLDGTAYKKRMRGYFPCGRSKSDLEGKEIKFPRNVTCDACFIQLIFSTKTFGKQFMCADIEILGGDVEDCSGQCMNGGMCVNGGCQCRKGFTGNFCQIKEYVPDNTNYAKYLKYFLFFIVMVLIIIALLFGAWLLFKNAGRIMGSIKSNAPERVEDDDNLAGAGTDHKNKKSKYGQNRDL